MFVQPGYLGGGLIALAATNTDNAFNSAPQSSYTFSNRAIGAAPAAGRRRFVFVMASVVSSDPPNIGTPTIGGIAAVGGQQVIGTVSAAYFFAELPTGTTATIFLDVSGTAAGCGISVFSVISGPDGISVDADGDSETNPPLNFALDLPAGSVGIAGAMNANGSAFNWTGLTEVYDQDINTDDFFSSAFAVFSSPSLAHPIEADTVVNGDFYAGIAIAISPA